MRKVGPARLGGVAVVAGQPVETELQHHLGRSRRPAALTFHVFETFEEAAYVEQDPAELRSRGVERPPHALARGERRFRKGLDAAAAILGTDDVQLAVTRGIKWARVKSARSRSPACNCVGSINARPSRDLRRASQASGLSAGIERDAGAADGGFDFALRDPEMLAEEWIDDTAARPLQAKQMRAASGGDLDHSIGAGGCKIGAYQRVCCGARLRDRAVLGKSGEQPFGCLAESAPGRVTTFSATTCVRRVMGLRSTLVG